MKEIYSREKFYQFVTRERVRADRSQSTFSFLVLNIKDNPKFKDNVKPFIIMLKKRVRCCDVIGWFDEKTIGLLLSDTKEEGAQVLADSICSGIVPKESTIQYKIFSYPSQNIPDQNDEIQFDEINSFKSSVSSDNETLPSALQAIVGQQKTVWKKVANLCVSLFV